MNKLFTGLGVAMITPFNDKGEVDFPALQNLTEFLIAGEVDYLVVQGTTGETPTLSREEKRATLDFIIEVNAARKPIVLGMSGNNTLQLCAEIEAWDMSGISGLLVASPAYNKPSQKGIYIHYKEVASHTDLPIILYNVPGRTASNISAETTLQLSHEVANIVAVKEASGDMQQMLDILNNAPDNFAVLSGDDGLVLPLIGAGGHGLISVLGNAFPAELSKAVHAAMVSNMQIARATYYQVHDIIPLLFEEGNPAGIKELLRFRNICQNKVRLPLVPVSKDLSAQLYRKVAELEWVSV